MSMNYPIFLNIFCIVYDLALTFSCSVKGGEGAFEEVKGGDKQVSEITNYTWGGGVGGVYCILALLVCLKALLVAKV